MTVILPPDDGFSRGAAADEADAPQGIGIRDYGESLARPIAAVQYAAEQCLVDCSIHDATRAFDGFTQKLTAQNADIDSWPGQFTAEAKRVRDEFANRIPDGPARDRFDAGFDLFAKAKAVETRGLATHKRIATNRAELDRALSGYGDMISRAMNPVSVEFALNQGEAAIRNQVDAKVLSDDEGKDLTRRYRTDIAGRRARQLTLDDPVEAAKELGKTKGGMFSDLPGGQRKDLAGHAAREATARAMDTAHRTAQESRRAAAQETLRREEFLNALRDRTDTGDATLTDISAAVRDGIIDTGDAAAERNRLEQALAHRRREADRVGALLVAVDAHLDPHSDDDRRAADIHWRDLIEPLGRGLPPAERIRLEDHVVFSTGIAPKPAVDALRAGLLSPDPQLRVEAARRARVWLTSMPPIPLDITGLERRWLEAIDPYLDLPLPDPRKIELAELEFDRARSRIDREPNGPMGSTRAAADGPDEEAGDGSPADEEGGVGWADGADDGPDDDSDADAGAGLAVDDATPQLQQELEERLSNPDTRTALREQLLADLQVEADWTGMSAGEFLERERAIRDALPADPPSGTEVAFAPAIPIIAGLAPEALASALTAIGLGSALLSLKGDTNSNTNATEGGKLRRSEDDDGRDRGSGRSDEGDASDGAPADGPDDEPGDGKPAGRKARDSSRNERHGDGGRALDKNRERLKELEREIKVVPKKERLKLVRKKEKILRYSKKKKSGTEHSRTRKR